MRWRDYELCRTVATRSTDPAQRRVAHTISFKPWPRYQDRPPRYAAGRCCSRMTEPVWPWVDVHCGRHLRQRLGRARMYEVDGERCLRVEPLAKNPGGRPLRPTQVGTGYVTQDAIDGRVMRTLEEAEAQPQTGWSFVSLPQKPKHDPMQPVLLRCPLCKADCSRDTGSIMAVIPGLTRTGEPLLLSPKR